MNTKSNTKPDLSLEYFNNYNNALIDIVRDALADVILNDVDREMFFRFNGLVLTQIGEWLREGMTVEDVNELIPSFVNVAAVSFKHEIKRDQGDAH